MYGNETKKLKSNKGKLFPIRGSNHNLNGQDADSVIMVNMFALLKVKKNSERLFCETNYKKFIRIRIARDFEFHLDVINGGMIS